MLNPFKFRPQPPSDSDPEPVEWEDNWACNFLAYASTRLTPGWCATEEHPTTRLAIYLWTTCGCCMFYRGAVIGVVVGLVAGIAAAQAYNLFG